MHKTRKIICKANAIEKNRKCNIIIITTDEEYETMLCETGHNFYALNSPALKKWDKEEYPIPDNYCILGENTIPNWLDFDLILIQHKTTQYKQAIRVKQALEIPLVVVEKAIPQHISKLEQQIETAKTYLGDLNVFTSEEVQAAWGIDQNNYVLTEEDCVVKWKVLFDQFYEGVV